MSSQVSPHLQSLPQIYHHLQQQKLNVSNILNGTIKTTLVLSDLNYNAYDHPLEFLLIDLPPYKSSLHSLRSGGISTSICDVIVVLYTKTISGVDQKHLHFGIIPGSGHGIFDVLQDDATTYTPVAFHTFYHNNTYPQSGPFGLHLAGIIHKRIPPILHYFLSIANQTTITTTLFDVTIRLLWNGYERVLCNLTQLTQLLDHIATNFGRLIRVSTPPDSFTINTVDVIKAIIKVSTTNDHNLHRRRVFKFLSQLLEITIHDDEQFVEASLASQKHISSLLRSHQQNHTPGSPAPLSGGTNIATWANPLHIPRLYIFRNMQNTFRTSTRNENRDTITSQTKIGASMDPIRRLREVYSFYALTDATPRFLKMKYSGAFETLTHHILNALIPRLTTESTHVCREIYEDDELIATTLFAVMGWVLDDCRR